MLWYKSWLETRWRFVIGLVVLLCSAVGAVLVYPQIAKLTGAVPPNLGGPLGDRVRETMQLAQTFRGYVWANWFRQNLAQTGTLFAILLGIASLVSESSGALFTLSLPVSRPRLLHVRAASGLAQLLVLAVVSTFAIVVIAPAVGQRYDAASALVHALCFFVAASVFFSLAMLLSTAFSDPWRPLMITLAVALLLAVAQLFDVRALSLYRVMSGESWFRDATVPWGGLAAAALVSAAIYSAAVRGLVRRDF